MSTLKEFVEKAKTADQWVSIKEWVDRLNYEDGNTVKAYWEKEFGIYNQAEDDLKEGQEFTGGKFRGRGKE